MIYFDENKIAYGQLHIITENGKTLIYQCEDEIYKEFQQGKRIWQDNALVINPNYEAEQAEKEAERVAMLRITPRDFLLALVELGVDYNLIKQLKASNPQVEIELDYCNYVYRGNPLLDQLAPQFNITKEQLDNLFKMKGGY